MIRCSALRWLCDERIEGKGKESGKRVGRDEIMIFFSCLGGEREVLVGTFLAWRIGMRDPNLGLLGVLC